MKNLRNQVNAIATLTGCTKQEALEIIRRYFEFDFDNEKEQLEFNDRLRWTIVREELEAYLSVLK